jgi:hypothetical protein
VSQPFVASAARCLSRCSPLPQTPAEFLKAIKGKAVLVKLNSGVDYRGAGESLKGPQHSTAAAQLDRQPATAILCRHPRMP